MEFFSDWNFYGLCAFGLLCIGAIVWQRMYYARLAMEHLARVRRQEALEAKAIERRERLEALDAYNEACNGSGSDEYRRRLNAGIANQHSASMEPFCGEGKKKRERKQESRANEWESHSPLFFGVGAAHDTEPSRPVSHSSYLGHGGSFDGGGASGDWSSSSSSSSDSGSCSSSSSDSGSSSCSSSD